MPTEKKLTGYPSIDKPWLKYYDIEDVNQTFPSETIYQHIYNRNRNNLNSVALNYFGVRITYKELFKRIDIVAKAFVNMGIKKRDIVSFCMPTTPETIYSIYALNKIGAIANMIDLSTNNLNIIERINRTSSTLLIMVDFLKDKLSDVVDNSSLKHIISVSPTNSLPKPIQFLIKLKSKQQATKLEGKYIDWKDFIAYGKRNTEIMEVDNQENLPALIVYTGGTTGVPKGAVLGNNGINATIWQLKHTKIQSKPGDKYLDIMPPFIAYGVVCGIHNPLSEQQEIVIIPKFEATKFAGYVKKYKPNHVIGVPALFETMTQSELLKNEDLSFLQNMICGGDKLTPSSKELVDNFLLSHNSSAKVAQGFGMTEVGTSVTYTIANIEKPTPNSIGCPLTHVNIKIVEPGTENELPFNTKGEICISTPSLMLGYYNNGTETENVLKTHTDGTLWIHSQDIGYMNEQGELFFMDRVKRMIVRPDGHNVWPGAIENIISQHDAVLSCVVVGIPCKDNSNGAIPTAFIVLKPGCAEKAEYIISEIDSECKKYLPERDVALDYKIRESLPKTTVGKVDFKKVEELETRKQ